jgi:RecB family exonuclease
MNEKRHLSVIPPELVDPGLPGGAFSHAQYETYKSCGRAYEFKYIKEQRIAPSPATARGIAIHTAVETALRHKQRQGEVPSLDGQLAVVADTFEKAKEEVDWGDEDPGKVKDVALSLYRVYHTQGLPKILPVEVETPFVVKVGSVTVRGVIDLIDLEKEQPGDPGRLAVVDLKTSSSKWSENEVKNDTQLSLYTAVKRIIHGRIDNLVSTKTPALHRLSTTRGPRDHRNLIEDYEQTVDAIKKGIFLMAPIDSWKCTPKYCSYYSQCRGRD